MAEKIGYSDKVAIQNNQLPDINKWTDANANEVKLKYNGLVDELGLGGVNDNVRVVSINTGGATNKIKDTLDAITDSSSTKQYLVEVRPGTYIEDDFVIPQYITLTSTGGRLVTTIQANTTTGDLITMSTGSSVRGFTITGKTSSGAKNIVVSSTGTYEISSNTIIDSDIGIDINNSGAKVDIINHNLQTVADTITDGILLQSGTITVDIVKVVNSSTITNILRCSGDSVVTARNIESFSPNVSIGIKIENTSRTNIYGVSLVGANDGVVVEDGITSTFDNVKIFNSQQDGFRCDIGDGSTKELTFTSVLIDSASVVSPRYDINLICPNTTAKGILQADVSKSFINPQATLITQVLNSFEADEKFEIDAELAVGSQVRPKESVFGEGDSHVNELVYTFDGTSTYTDVTDAARSASGSTFTFDGLSVNNSIYVSNLLLDSSGSPIPFYGIKASIGTAWDLGTGNIVLEYWNGSWTEFNGSTNLSGGSYWKYAKDYFGRTGSYHIKFDPDILSDWVPNDPITLGTNRYWIRFRITSAITIAPILEQFKISSSRSEKNPDGTDEYHGFARTIKKITLDASGPIEGNMQNSSIYVDENVGVAFISNRYTAVADIRGYSFELPEDCDTSGKLIIVWKGRFSATGNAQFTVRLKVVKPGDSYTSSEPVASADLKTVLTPLTAVTADTREDFRVDVDISDAIPARDSSFGDEIWFSIQNTTRSGNFEIVKVSANYLSDFNGRHL